MAAVTKLSPVTESRSLKAPQVLSVLVVILAVIAAGVGLFVPGAYRDNMVVTPQNRGGDLVTLALVAPTLLISVFGAVRGSTRSIIVWLGSLSYMIYTYTGAATAYRFNNLFLVYVALLALSVFALYTLLQRIDVAAVMARFDAKAPRIPIILFMGFLSVMLTMAYLGQMMPFFIDGTLPTVLAQIEAPTMFVWALDLGFIVPLMILGAIGLWRREAAGYLISGVMLIKCATMGLALLGMTLFAYLAGVPVEPLVAVWVFVAVGGLSLSTWFLRHCRG